MPLTKTNLNHEKHGNTHVLNGFKAYTQKVLTFHFKNEAFCDGSTIAYCFRSRCKWKFVLNLNRNIFAAVIKESVLTHFKII